MNALAPTRKRPVAPLCVAGALMAALLACQEVTIPNYNASDVDQLKSSPQKETVNAAVVGLLAGMRIHAFWMPQLGILGRELYLLGPLRMLFWTYFLEGPLNPGPAGGTDVGWTPSYNTLRTAVTILDAVDKVRAYTDEEKQSIRGFVKTVMAIEYMNQLRIRDTFGIVVEVVGDPTQMKPFVSRDSGWTYTAALLDEAQRHLLAGGGKFPFPLTSGFKDFSAFNTPAQFVQVNRAIKARVDVYREKWPDALIDLNGSFIDTVSGSAGLDKGVYHVFSTASGDQTNPFFDPFARAVPSFLTDAKIAPDGTPDKRAVSKTAKGNTITSNGVSSDVKITRYASNSAPIPIIKNEELILLRAEVNYQLKNTTAAMRDLNFIRVNSGGLAPLPIPYSGNILDEILYNRRYSLAFEYGHRWVDMRRYNRLNSLERGGPTGKIFSLVPIPFDECTGRVPVPGGCTEVKGF